MPTSTVSNRLIRLDMTVLMSCGKMRYLTSALYALSPLLQHAVHLRLLIWNGLFSFSVSWCSSHGSCKGLSTAQLQQTDNS